MPSTDRPLLSHTIQHSPNIHSLLLTKNLISRPSPSDSDTTADYDANARDDNALRANQTVASTSAPQFNARCCENCAKRLQNQPANIEETNIDDFDHLNGNGIVRMDMSKIIDATGLPTYDAALKLESCGYV